MSFVRAVSFTLSKDEAAELAPGTHPYTALISGRKYVAQALPGLVQTSVWRNLNASGTKVNFTIFSEWSTLEDMQIYANNVIIKELETILDTDSDPVTVQVYEVLG